MLNLSLTEISRGGADGAWQVPPDHAMWEGTRLRLRGPVHVEAEAKPIAEGSVLVRGHVWASLDVECRRCLRDVEQTLDEPVEILFEPLQGEEADELAGEVYPLPARGDVLALEEPIREFMLLHSPEFALCAESCRGLCPKCGADLNEAACECVPEAEPGPWDALKKIKFD